MSRGNIVVKRDNRKLDALYKSAPERAEKVVKGDAENIVTDIRANWSGHYPPASAPGQPPGVRSGTLDLAIKAFKFKGSGARVSYMVGVDGKAYYWWWLENGSRKMRARPFLRPALYRFEKRGKSNFTTAFQR